MRFETYWAQKLLSKKRKTIGNLLLIILVTVPLVCCLVFVDSMIEGITEKYICLSGGHINFDATLDSDIQCNDLISKVTSSYAVVYSKTSTSNVMIKGIDEYYFNPKRLSQIKVEVSEEFPTAQNSVMISQTLADRLKLEIGDKFALMLLSNPDTTASGSFSAVVRPVMVSLGAIYSSGYSQLDENLIFGSFEFFSNSFKSKIINYEMLTDNNDPYYNYEIADDFMLENPGILGYRIWNELNSSVYENFVNSRQMVLIIILVIGAIACFYCGTIAQEMVQENYSSICIMRMLGANEHQIKKTIFITVFSLILSGLLLGYLFGLLISFNLTPLLKNLAQTGFSAFQMYLLDFSVKINPIELLVMALLIIVLSSISVLIALKNEKNLSPLQLLQN